MTARRYLLGELSEDERVAIERAYFADQRAGDAIAAEEDALIDDYVSGRLSARDRERFEGHYLASPVHRQRVATIRRLSEIADSEQRTERSRRSRVLASLAAAAVLLLAASLTTTPAASTPPAVAAAPPAAVGTAPTRAIPPRVFAFSLASGNVRGADDQPPLVIPPNADVVALRLEPTANRAATSSARAVVATLGGESKWEGDARSPAAGAPGLEIDIPAARLPPDDYIVTLYGRAASGGERERDRYFLRVRAR
jgi:anti-sigma factor RsiW